MFPLVRSVSVMRVELRGSYSSNSMLESGKKDERLNYGSSKGNEGWENCDRNKGYLGSRIHRI